MAREADEPLENKRPRVDEPDDFPPPLPAELAIAVPLISGATEAEAAAALRALLQDAGLRASLVTRPRPAVNIFYADDGASA